MSEVLSYLTVFKTVILTTQPGFYLVKVDNRNTIDTTARCEMCLKLKLSSHLPKEFFVCFTDRPLKTSLLSCVPCMVKTCSNVPYVLTCSRANVSCSHANMLCVFTCSRCSSVTFLACVLTCQYAMIPLPYTTFMTT